MTVSKGGRCCSHGYGAHDARKGMKVKGSMRQAYALVASVTELIVGLSKRESNQPRPGVAPGCPQPMLRAQPCVCGAERECTAAMPTCPSRFVRESKDPCKMTYSRMAPIERGLGDKRAHANEHVGGRCVGCRGEQASAQACGGKASSSLSLIHI